MAGLSVHPFVRFLSDGVKNDRKKRVTLWADIVGFQPSIDLMKMEARELINQATFKMSLL